MNSVAPPVAPPCVARPPPIERGRTTATIGASTGTASNSLTTTTPGTGSSTTSTMVASTGIAGAGRRFLLRDAIFALTRPRRAFVVSFLLVFLTDLFAFLGAARLAAHFREVLPCFDVALRAVRENKMVTVKVREIRFDPGFCGSKPQGTVTVSANIQSDDLGRLEIGVQVLNQGSEELNIQEAHVVLQRFAEELANALIRPLAFD